MRMTLAFFIFLVLFNESFGQSFEGLGDLSGWIFRSRAQAISGDGSTVVGYSYSKNGIEAFHWTRSTGMQGLGDLDGGLIDSRAYDVSHDGSIIVGVGTNENRDKAVRWFTGSISQLDDGCTFCSSAAWGTSGDGLTIVGEVDLAFVWTGSGGFELGDFDGGWESSIAFDASFDGSVITGYGSSMNGQEAFRWTPSGLFEPLGDLPGGGFLSNAQEISDDGNTIIGFSQSGSGIEGFRWTPEGGMQPIGMMPTGTNADGSVVVGALNGTAYIWTSDDGLRNLTELLTSEYGLDLNGWSLTAAAGVSTDGTHVVGWGNNPDGKEEAWLATIPSGFCQTSFAPLRQSDPAWRDSRYATIEVDRFINDLPASPLRDDLERLKQCVTIGTKGCLLSCVAMVANAINNRASETPETVHEHIDRVLNQNGALTTGFSRITGLKAWSESAQCSLQPCSGCDPNQNIARFSGGSADWNAIRDAIDGIDRIPQFLNSDTTTEQFDAVLRSSLAAGSPVIMSLNRGSHWVLASRIDGQHPSSTVCVVDPGRLDGSRDRQVPVSSITNARVLGGPRQRGTDPSTEMLISTSRGAMIEVWDPNDSAIVLAQGDGLLFSDIPGVSWDQTLPIGSPDAEPTPAMLAAVDEGPQELYIPGATPGRYIVRLTSGEQGPMSLNATLSGGNRSLNVSVIETNLEIDKPQTFDVIIIEGCTSADLAEPFRKLDLADVVAFITAFGASEPTVDFAEPYGLLDLADIVAFVVSFQAGCP